MKLADYDPLFPYFGGKSSIAGVVWSALGNVENYVEPFFGSGATLFLRPHSPRIETVNDADGFVANFWRAVKCDPQAVAEHADNPVNECDLHARHLWLVGNRERITDRLCGDPDWFDAKAAGWWCWGLCCWIGSGWCSGTGPWQSIDGVITLGDAGRGVNRQRPHLGDAIQRFADRLRNVRVCCGDWARVCTSACTDRHGLTGIFFDPPYADTAKRTSDLYAVDCEQVAHRVREWCIANGDNPLLRIVLAGYDGEHAMPDGWRIHEWKARGGYENQSEEASGNCRRERLWFSPHCIDIETPTLFSIAPAPSP